MADPEFRVSYTEPIENVSFEDAQTVLDALQTHHDPDNGKRVNHATITFNEDGTYNVSPAIHHENVAQADFSAEVDNVSSVVGNLPVGPTATDAAENVRAQRQ